MSVLQNTIIAWRENIKKEIKGAMAELLRSIELEVLSFQTACIKEVEEFYDTSYRSLEDVIAVCESAIEELSPYVEERGPIDSK
jgi:hypothetical protein